MSFENFKELCAKAYAEADEDWREYYWNLWIKVNGAQSGISEIREQVIGAMALARGSNISVRLSFPGVMCGNFRLIIMEHMKQCQVLSAANYLIMKSQELGPVNRAARSLFWVAGNHVGGRCTTISIWKYQGIHEGTSSEVWGMVENHAKGIAELCGTKLEIV